MPTKKQNPFKLKNFMGVDPDVVAKLELIGIKHTGQMLSAGQTPESRSSLARRNRIPEDVVLELVKLSDLARLPSVKGIRARLYYAAGVDSVEKIAACEPQALLLLTADFVQKTGFMGTPPLPKEVSSTIANAKKLPMVVEW